MNRERVPGDLIENGGQLWRVVKVMDSGAKCVPLHVQPVTITNKLTGKTSTFTPHGQMVTFSSQSPKTKEALKTT